MAVGWITALRVIPWSDVVENAPAVLRGAKKLWSMVGQPPAEQKPDRLAALQQEVAQLREQSNSAANLISSLAEQNARLVEAVEILRIRTRMLLVISCALAVAALGFAVFLLAA